MEDKTKDFFWPSYVDLLTALFAVVLVLFVLSFKMFKDREKKLEEDKKIFQVNAAKYQRIEEIDRQIKALEERGTFLYDSTYRRFLVKGFQQKEIFDPHSDVIKPEYESIALQAGREISHLVSSFAKDKNVSFLVIIEGNTAKREDGSVQGRIDGNYELSYRRSLALNNLWQRNGIILSSNAQLILSGSGIFGVGRDPANEGNNKRFLIQVVPKIRKQ